MAVLYVTWSLVQGLLPVHNPFKSTNLSTDQNIYSILDWKGNPTKTVIVVILVLLVAMPIATVLFWSLSLIRRRYIVVDGAKQQEENTTDQAPKASDNDEECPSPTMSEPGVDDVPNKYQPNGSEEEDEEINDDVEMVHVQVH